MIDPKFIFASVLFKPTNFINGRTFSSNSVPSLIHEVLNDAMRKATGGMQRVQTIYINDVSTRIQNNGF